MSVLAISFYGGNVVSLVDYFLIADSDVVHRSLGQSVFCSEQEADYEIASYARQHGCMGILGQDSDFIIYDRFVQIPVGLEKMFKLQQKDCPYTTLWSVKMLNFFLLWITVINKTVTCGFIL